jgi:hypothetical protein
MKQLTTAIASLTLCLGLTATAQTVVKETKETTGPAGTETTTTTTTGTISEFGGERLVIRSETASEPLTYRFTKTTTYVDEAGAPVSIETVRSGLPVTVHYVKEGDALVARKVIVKKKVTTRPPATRTETKTTTVMGTVNEFSPERIIIRSETSPDPLTYRFTKTTTYVDEAGTPVSIETVKSGLPVTVHYTTEGDARMATKVVVRKTKTKIER